MAVVPQRPPKSSREVAAGMVEDDDVGFVADSARSHRVCEELRRGDLHVNRVVGIDDVVRPVHERGAGYMTEVIFLPGTDVIGPLNSTAEIGSRHIASDIDHAQTWL